MIMNEETYRRHIERNRKVVEGEGEPPVLMLTNPYGNNVRHDVERILLRISFNWPLPHLHDLSEEICHIVTQAQRDADIAWGLAQKQEGRREVVEFIEQQFVSRMALKPIFGGEAVKQNLHQFNIWAEDWQAYKKSLGIV